MLQLASGVAVDGAGNVYITQWDFHVLKVDTSGILTTLAGNGQWVIAAMGGLP
jgi:hypothetical protein